MKKLIITSLVIILFSGCTTIKLHKNTSSLQGQKWVLTYSWARVFNEAGNTWIFLPNNRFTEQEWYSGGAYWNHYYSGTYSY